MQRGRQIPGLERRAITERAGLVREDREIMPRIVNGAVPTEVALMLPDDLFAATDDDAIGIGTHLHGPARGPTSTIRTRLGSSAVIRPASPRSRSPPRLRPPGRPDRKSTRLNSSH